VVLGFAFDDDDIDDDAADDDDDDDDAEEEEALKAPSFVFGIMDDNGAAALDV
jgi:hypothetical protein